MKWATGNIKQHNLWNDGLLW